MVTRLAAQPSLQRPGLCLWRVHPSFPLTLQFLLGQRTSLFSSSSHKGPGFTSSIQPSPSVSKTKTQAKSPHPILLRIGFAPPSPTLRPPLPTWAECIRVVLWEVYQVLPGVPLPFLDKKPQKRWDVNSKFETVYSFHSSDQGLCQCLSQQWLPGGGQQGTGSWSFCLTVRPSRTVTGAHRTEGRVLQNFPPVL